MKSLIKTLFISLVLVSCSSKESVDPRVSSDASYGYTEKNPIKVGNNPNGPANERNYLNSLSGPNGETINYIRNGSCCPFESKNNPYGSGMLDAYAVTYEGKKDTVVLYLNMYDKASLKAPVGFKFK